MFDHCVNAYAAMKAKSRMIGEQLAYEGALTKLIVELGLSNPYYTAIKKNLEGMGCIQQIRRGGGGQPSIWALLADPTYEMWATAERTKATPTQEKDEMVQQQFRDLEKRIQTLEGQMNALIFGKEVGRAHS